MLWGMGQLIPEDFPLSRLKNEAERRVVEAFRDQLNDGWLILPAITLWAKDRGDYELDVVLVHHAFGVVDIEVKGHKLEIRNGLWSSGGVPLERQNDSLTARRHRMLMDYETGYARNRTPSSVSMSSTGLHSPIPMR